MIYCNPNAGYYEFLYYDVFFIFYILEPMGGILYKFENKLVDLEL